MTKLTEDVVLNWVKTAPLELRELHAEIAGMWRRGYVALKQYENGDLYAELTALGRSVGKETERVDAPVCSGCKKSSGVLVHYVLFNDNNEEVLEWMHEECFLKLPVACNVCRGASGDVKTFMRADGKPVYAHEECFPALPPDQFPWAPIPDDWTARLRDAALPYEID